MLKTKNQQKSAANRDLSTVMIHLTRHSLNSTFCLFLNVQKIHLTRHSGKPQENHHFWGVIASKTLENGGFREKKSDSLNSTFT